MTKTEFNEFVKEHWKTAAAGVGIGMAIGAVLVAKSNASFQYKMKITPDQLQQMLNDPSLIAYSHRDKVAVASSAHQMFS